MKHTLLLVDDEPDCLAPMETLLQEDYSVLAANSGAEALESLDKNSVDIVIADQRMPKMTGVELLTKVRELYPDIVRVVLTAYTDFDAMIEAINEGRVYRYIIKPWDVDDMRLVIRQALEWREMQLRTCQLAADLAEAHRDLAERHKELERAYADLAKAQAQEASDEE